MRRPERRFYFELAEKFGMPVGVMLATISSRELTEWMAYYALRNAPEKPKSLTPAELRAMFAHRVMKKKGG